MAQVLLGYKPDGKPIRKSFSGKTRKEAAAKMSSVSTMVFQDTDHTQASAMSVEDLAAYWISIYAHRTIKGIRNLISQMLKFACLQKLIQSNPAELVVIPKQRRAVGAELGKHRHGEPQNHGQSGAHARVRL